MLLSEINETKGKEEYIAECKELISEISSLYQPARSKERMSLSDRSSYDYKKIPRGERTLKPGKTSVLQSTIPILRDALEKLKKLETVKHGEFDREVYVRFLNLLRDIRDKLVLYGD